MNAGTAARRTPHPQPPERHPSIRLALHTSGPLLEWLAARERSYLERLARLVERGQVEPWGGGFYEPVLAAIPEPDRRAQIERMAGWLDRELGGPGSAGCPPRGLWLTERVWEPALAASLARAGVAYTAVDDAHFVAAGLEREALWGYYRTEDQGESLAVFPIHRELRYAVPFAPPDEVVEILRRVAAGGEGRIAVLGDDGEKFGVWPGTHKLCYEEGWLEHFAEALEANPWIQIRTPAEALREHPSRGLVYLPTASYHELQEWALSPAAHARYERAAARLEPEFGAAAHDLLRGGHWRNFLARYPETNRLHKRMLRASRRLHEPPHGASAADPAGRDAALEHVWRAQCATRWRGGRSPTTRSFGMRRWEGARARPSTVPCGSGSRGSSPRSGATTRAAASRSSTAGRRRAGRATEAGIASRSRRRTSS